MQPRASRIDRDFPGKKLRRRSPKAPSPAHSSGAPVAVVLPADQKTLGLITVDDLETSLWRPFGSRRFLHVRPKDPVEAIMARGIEYIVVNSEVVEGLGAGSFDSWVARVRGHVVQKVALRYRAARGPFDWYVVRLDVESTGKP